MTTTRDLAAELRRAGLADVDDSIRRRAEYSTDASNYRVVPHVVAFPRSTDEIVAAVEAARMLGVPITARGGGTSTAGNSIGAGLVLDCSRHLNRVLAVDTEARTAQAEPGAILDTITEAAAPHGLRFGPDPSTHARATIGGSIGNNACGSRALRYGRTADNVVALDVLTPSGLRFTARRYGRDGLTSTGPEGALLTAVNDVLAPRLGMVRTEFGRFTRQVSGYSLEHLLPENGHDLARFLSGTEGTLGVILGATVRLVDSPKAVALAVLGYPDMPSAAEAVPGLLPHQPVALEGMDARLVNVVRQVGHGREADRRRRLPRLRDRHRRYREGAVAHSRGRRRAGRAHTCRGPSLARLGGRGGSTGAPRGVPARVREPDVRAPPRWAQLRALR